MCRHAKVLAVIVEMLIANKEGQMEAQETLNLMMGFLVVAAASINQPLPPQPGLEN